eukprot:m.212910 g.212910  ORF g.212910 m.212910 type:complete len:1258 (-) comp33137_c0_seq1:546-4319(-)
MSACVTMKTPPTTTTQQQPQHQQQPQQPLLRSESQPLVQESRHRRACDAPPCRVCGVVTAVNGDANADCDFNMADISFVMLYLLESVDNFKSARGIKLNTSLMSKQRLALDGNEDTNIDTADARFLARAYVGKLNFIRNLVVLPVQGQLSRGEVTVNVSEVSASGSVPTGFPSEVFVDVAHYDSQFASTFDTSNITRGVLLSVQKQGLFGFVARMERVGPVFASGQSLIRPTKCSAPSSTKSCGANSTTIDAFRYSDADGMCVLQTVDTCKLESDDDAAVGGEEEEIPFFETYTACVAECHGSIVHTLSFRTNVVAPDIGVSLLVATFNADGVLGSGRTVFMHSEKQPVPYGKLSLTIPVGPIQLGQNVPLIATRGYGPYITFNNSLASDDATNVFEPSFGGNRSFDISEDVNVGTVLFQFSATDADESPYGFMTYEIADPDAVYDDATGMWSLGPFSIEQATGWISVTGPLDYEMQSLYSFEVAASDNSPPLPKKGASTFFANIIDVNDNAPEFACAGVAAPNCVAGVHRVSIPADAPTNTQVFQMNALDADSGRNAEFNWDVEKAGDNTGQFYSMSSLGQILKSRVLNRVEGSTYDLKVLLRDQGIPSLTGQVPACTGGGNAAYCTYANVSVAVISDAHLVTVMSSMVYEEFMDLFSNVTGRHTCLDQLGSLLGFPGGVVMQEVARSSGSGLAEVTFYIIDATAADNTVLLETQVKNLLITRSADLATLGACAISSFGDRVDTAYTAHAGFFSDAACGTPLDFGDYEGASGSCVNNFGAALSARVFCSKVALGQVGVRVYGNVGCNMPTLVPNGSLSVFASANAPAMYENTCVSVAIPQRLGMPPLDIFFKASCSDLVPTINPASSTLDPFSNESNVNDTTVDGGNATTQTPSTTDPGLGAPDAVQAAPDNLAVVLGFSLGALCIWVILIALVLRFYRQRKQLKRAKMMVIAHQGDIQFGDPEPMVTQTDGSVVGGEIDPLTGQMTLYKDGMEVEDPIGIQDRMMPGMWGGQRGNPILNMLGDDEDLDESDDDDSLGNLSDFEDADFEAFADSLLDDHAVEDGLFGYETKGVTHRNPPIFGGAGTDGDESDDSLSDFENDTSSAGYLGVGVDSMYSVDNDDSLLDEPAQPKFGRTRTNSDGVDRHVSTYEFSSPVQAAQRGVHLDEPAQPKFGRTRTNSDGVDRHVSTHEFTSPVQAARRGMQTRDSVLSTRMSMASMTSMTSIDDDDLEEEYGAAIVVKPAYESVGQAWTKQAM